jgi:chemotaxis protein methyltransferase WspC
LNQPEAYHTLLTTAGPELDQLIEAVVVTETWFFRDREPFHVFARLAQQRQQRRTATGDRSEPDPRAALDASVRPLRVLSLPCASGEEPYSLAMALLDAGITETEFTIHAADISIKALTCAKRAVYGKNSFRGRALEFRDRHFRPIREAFTLNPAIRRCVQFARGNILDAGFLDGADLFDFIFCRNLLIYFDPAMQVLALSKLHRLLADDGVLFVGPAELPLVLTSGFINSGVPMAFACHKATRLGDSRGAGGELKSPQTRGGDADSPSDRRDRTALLGLGASPLDPLELAHQHAAAGCFAEAVAICNRYLADEGPSAQVFYLLGRIKDAQNDAAAIALYRKALYLEPNHYQALLHIARALEKSGDVEPARLYQRRAQRAQSKA